MGKGLIVDNASEKVAFNVHILACQCMLQCMIA